LQEAPDNAWKIEGGKTFISANLRLEFRLNYPEENWPIECEIKSTGIQAAINAVNLKFADFEPLP